MSRTAGPARAWGRWRERLAPFWAPGELRWLVAILVLAAVPRIAWVLYAARHPQELHDPTFFFLFAGQIAQGDGYTLPDGSPTAYYPVGYPAALGGVFALVWHTPIPDNLRLAAGFFQVFLGVATVGLAFEAGRRLCSPAVGLLAALLLALFPNLIFHTATYLSETLFNFLVLAALVVLLSGDWRERRLEPWRLVLFGALLGLSALVRPISLLFLPLLPAAWWVAGFGWRRWAGYPAAVLVVTAAVIAPWSIRNIIVMDAPVVISTNLGDNLCIGHNPNAPGFFHLPSCLEGYEHLERPEYEVRRNDDNIERAIRFAREHPLFELKLLSRKAYYTWRHDHDGLGAVESYGDDRFLPSGLRTALERVADGYFFVVISLGGLGLVGLAWPLEARRLFFLLALLALAGIPLVFFGDARFHVPVMPLLVVAAAWLVVEVVRTAPRLGARPVRAPAAPSGTPGGTFSSLSSARPPSDVEVAEGGTTVSEQDAL